MKKISVIIPIYNAARWVSDTIDSLVCQTYGNLELICIDDGSSDDSSSIIANYSAKYPQIRLYRQANAGVCVARNMGIEHATGEYIAFVDADDYVEPDMYEKMISQMEEEGSDVVFCEFTRFWEDGHTQTALEHSFEKMKRQPRDIKYLLFSTESHTEGNVLHTEDIHGSVCRSVFRKSLLRKNRIRFHPEIRFAEDQVFMLEYLNCCHKISYTEASYVWYRGWTKKRRYGQIYSNQMSLVKYQEQAVENNPYYSDKEKKRLIGYIKCTTYFTISNDEFSLNPNCVTRMKEYSKNPDFTSLLTIYNFVQKYRIRPDRRRIALFFLMKLRMWNLVKRLYPVKYY